jgi:hypothetical protein
MKLSHPLPLQTFVVALLVVMSTGILAARLVDASPAYLMRQREGQQLIYEARRNLLDGYEAMLDGDATYNYPYAFTEGMNLMVKDLLSHEILQVLGYGVPSRFDECRFLITSGLYAAMYSASGCFKSLLHAGIAGDCKATNPLCCVLYWRYPASLSDRLPVSQIDPQLIFWDGTKTVNGFFTNFSNDYLANYTDCAAMPTWPPNSNNTVADGAALSVDANGEWRFTRYRQPCLSFVEHHIRTPNSTQLAEFNLLNAAGTPHWKSAHQFGNVTIVAPIVVCVALLVGCLVMLLLFYFCTEPQTQKAQAELQELIESLETSTAELEAEISRRRASQSARQAPNGSFAKVAKQSLSPVELYGSSTPSHAYPSQPNLMGQRGPFTATPPRQEPARAFSSPSRLPSNLMSPAVLSRQGSQSQLQPHPASSGRRASITQDHRRSAQKQESSPPAPQQQSLQRTGSILSRSSSFARGVPSCPLSRASSGCGRSSSVPPSVQQPSQTFQNPLIGRQSFRR